MKVGAVDKVIATIKDSLLAHPACVHLLFCAVAVPDCGFRLKTDLIIINY